MALTDWKPYGDQSAVSAASAQAQAGSKSYLVDGTLGNDAMNILEKSERDSPSEGRVISYKYRSSSSNGNCGVMFRFQDANNWYGLVVVESNYLKLIKSVAGTFTKIEQQSDNFGTNSTWNKWRFTWWVDNGILHGRVEYDDAGTWKMAHNSDFTDASNELSGGGGVGVGCAAGSAGYSGSQHYWDETEVFY
jgi:hypothetical protein